MTRTLIVATIAAAIVAPVALVGWSLCKAAAQGDCEPDSDWDDFEDDDTPMRTPCTRCAGHGKVGCWGSAAHTLRCSRCNGAGTEPESTTA